MGVRHRRRTAVIAAAFMMAATVSCSSAADDSSAGQESAAPASAESPKPDFTQVKGPMFVERTGLLNGLGMVFTPPDIKTDVGAPNGPVVPPECGPIFWGPTPTQFGSESWSTMTPTKNSGFKLILTVPAERTDFAALVGKCGTIEHQGASVTVTPLSLPGVPQWATAMRTAAEGADGAQIIGLYRGLYISVVFNQTPAGDLAADDSDALARLFYEQVRKLESL